MGCLFSKCSNSSYEPKIKIIDCTPPGAAFDYVRPNGTISFSVDRKYNAPVVDIRFEGWYENCVRLWSYHTEQENIFYSLRGLHCRLPVLVLTIVVMILSFSLTNKQTKNGRE